jgi:hypothetical protein
MPRESAIAVLSHVSAGSLGVFTREDAAELGITRKQLWSLHQARVIQRVLPGVYRFTAVAPSSEQSLRAALRWGGPDAAAAGRSGGEWYGLEGVRALQPEVIGARNRGKCPAIIVHRPEDLAPFMIRTHRGLRVTGVEATLVALAHVLEPEAFEVACEDARRRQLTSMPSLRAYLKRYGKPGRPGVAPMRALLDELDPKHPSRSTLEVKTRRLLVANGITDFVREFPLKWKGKTYFFDFALRSSRTILETNGRRWHDDPRDFEHDNEKWSVPARHDYRIVFATFDKVTRCPDALIAELRATLRRSGRTARL